jgi:hypothetical protein
VTSRVPNLLIFALLQIGCVRHWQEQGASVPEILASEQPDRIRVTLSDSMRLDLRHPTITGDFLTGLHGDTSVAVPVAQVAHVAVRKGGATLPLRAFALFALVAMGIYYATVWKPY